MSEALRLAELLEKFIKEAALEQDGNTAKTVAELRRLASVEEQRDELLDALRLVMQHIPADAGGASLGDDMHRARKAIAAATKE